MPHSKKKKNLAFVDSNAKQLYFIPAFISVRPDVFNNNFPITQKYRELVHGHSNIPGISKLDFTSKS